MFSSLYKLNCIIYSNQEHFLSTPYIYHFPYFSVVVETCTGSSGQPCSSLFDGSFLCSAWGNFLNPHNCTTVSLFGDDLDLLNTLFNVVTVVSWRFFKRFSTMNRIQGSVGLWMQGLMLRSRSGKTRGKRKSLRWLLVLEPFGEKGSK